MVKTRSLAARLIADGHVRVNSVRVEQASKGIKAGDVVTVALERTVRVLKVVLLGERRGPAPEAEQIYDDLTRGTSDGPRPRP